MSGIFFTNYYFFITVIITNIVSCINAGKNINDNIDNDSTTPSNCWITLDAKKHFKIMDRLDENYADVRHKYQQAVGNDKFDKEMIEVMIKSKGAAIRAIHNANGDLSLIPAGLNLGGFGMLRLEKSVLFFHRLKLRNDTRFRLNYLKNDLFDMSLSAVLSLNDLHLVGSYERALTGDKRSSFIYAPTYGGVEFLLQDVNYKMEGRYRLLNDRLVIEHVLSNINTYKVMMTYASGYNNSKQQSVPLVANSLEEFLERLKIDIDEWLKDYFNDYLMYFGLAESSKNAEFQEYDKKKTTALNDYVDDVTRTLRKRILEVNAAHLKVPNFEFFGPNGVEIKLTAGTLRGLDTIYRRSVATGRKYNDLRKVDAIIGFSKLKVEYTYEAVVSSMNSPLSGKLILSADEMTAHMSLTLLEEPEAVDISFDFLQQMKPESLTLEGPASRLIANFKHLLEYHIIAVLTNTVSYSVKQLSTLAKCEPFLPGQTDPKESDYTDDVDQPESYDKNINNSDNKKIDNSKEQVNNNDKALNKGSDVNEQDKTSEAQLTDKNYPDVQLSGEDKKVDYPNHQKPHPLSSTTITEAQDTAEERLVDEDSVITDHTKIEQLHHVQNSESDDRGGQLGGSINKFVKNVAKGILGDVLVRKNESMEILKDGKKMHLNFDENIEFRKLKKGDGKNPLFKIKRGTTKKTMKFNIDKKSIENPDLNNNGDIYMQKVDSVEIELPKDLAKNFNVKKMHLNREQNIKLSEVQR